MHFRAGPHAVVPFLQAGFSDRALGDAASGAAGAPRVLRLRVTPALGGVAERGTTGVTRPLLHLGVLGFPRR